MADAYDPFSDTVNLVMLEHILLRLKRGEEVREDWHRFGGIGDPRKQVKGIAIMVKVMRERIAEDGAFIATDRAERHALG